MVRLKPSEKRLLDVKAKERGLKPTQFAYEAIMAALSARYTMEEICDAIQEFDSAIEGLNRRVERLEPQRDTER